QGSGLVAYGTGTVDGHAAFGVTWPKVDYFGGSADPKQDTFQLVLIDRSDTGAGNFDVEFNYAQIQWETGSNSEGVNGLGGDSARAGSPAGPGAAGPFYELPGSGTPGSFLDSSHTGLINGDQNSGVLGRYVYQFRGGVTNDAPGLTPVGDQTVNEGNT